MAGSVVPSSANERFQPLPGGEGEGLYRDSIGTLSRGGR